MRLQNKAYIKYGFFFLVCINCDINMNAYMLKWYDVLIPVYSPESKLWNCSLYHWFLCINTWPRLKKTA